LTRLAAGGFRDITRIASSDARLWSGISLESRQALLPVLKEFNQIISEFIESLEFRDEKELHKLFYQASQYRGSLPVDGRGALSANSMLTVYITDKPGVLGHVTTLLGNNGINISNIRIRELRAYEGGCLQLMLQDGNQAIKAAWLLQEAGYVCD
jgi:prephenate dehydrogenase